MKSLRLSCSIWRSYHADEPTRTHAFFSSMRRLASLAPLSATSGIGRRPPALRTSRKVRGDVGRRLEHLLEVLHRAVRLAAEDATAAALVAPTTVHHEKGRFTASAARVEGAAALFYYPFQFSLDAHWGFETASQLLPVLALT